MQIMYVQFFTFLTVGFALLHVKGLVPDGSLAGRTLETLNVVGHLQGVHDFLITGERIRNLISTSARCCWSTREAASMYYCTEKCVKCLSWLKLPPCLLFVILLHAAVLLLPPWSSFCTWRSLERIGYRGTWYSRQTLSPRRSLLHPGPPYTVNT